MAEFNTLSMTFLVQPCYIPLKHHEGCNTIYDIIQNPVLHRVRSLLDKDPRFVSYVTNSAQDLTQTGMKSMFSSNQLKMSIENMNSQRLRTCLLIAINRAHRQEALFFCSFLRVCVDSHDRVIDNPNLDPANDIPLLRNNMIDPPKLEKQNLPKYNRALISVVSLALLCYAPNERSNLFQRVIGYYAFSANISKYSVESLHQMSIIVSYESIQREL